MYKKIILLYTIVFIPFLLTAQTWQWGISGGTLGTASKDVIVDMTTDKAGNIYALASIAAVGTCFLGDTSFQSYGGNTDILLFSYSCDNKFRWAKMIGSNFTPDRATAIAIDSLNNVFITGYTGGSNFKIADDTTTASNSVKAWFIASFDTSGNFKWFRQPTPDTVTIFNQKYYQFYDIVSKNDGFVGLARLGTGTLSNSNITITTSGIYLLNYTAQGVLQQAIPMDMQINPDVTSFNNIRMARMPSGKIIIAGIVTAPAPSINYNFSINNTPITHPIFIAQFHQNGNASWVRTGLDPSPDNANSFLSGFLYRPKFDNITKYIVGAGRTYPNLSFMGTTFSNNISGSAMPYVVALDTLGNLVWIQNASTNATTAAKGVTSNNQIYLAGDYPLRLEWQGQVLQNNFNQGYDIFIAKLDPTTGNVISLDSLDGDFGYNDAATAIVSDNKGNIYIGGEMGNQLYVGNQTLQSSGGTSDFFIAKFGTANCSNVVPITLQHFTAKQKNGQQVQCSWQSLQEINGSHYIVQRGTTPTQFTNIATITAAGKPNVYAYTDTINTTALQGAKNLFYRLVMVEKDGTFQYSNIAAINLTQYQQIQVYPNPANNHVMLILPYPTQKVEPVQLYNLQGTLVLQTHLNAFTQILNIPIQTLPKATYLIKVKGFATAVVVKE
jgi:hypothetical protein